MKKAVVIGLGSMGRRRIRLMQAMPDAPEIVGVNRSAERRAQVEKEFGIRTYATLAEAIAAARPQVAFLCTAPASHGSAVMECIDAGLDIFMEINLLGDWYAEAAARAAAKGVKLFISSTPVYRREMKYVADAVHGEPVCYMFHCGQYLPDWHPWEDYHGFFAARKETNGCREILCVELPWIEKAFGRVESISVMSGRMTSLDIDFPDHYMVSLRHEGGTKGMYCQDIVSRKGLRRLEVFSEKLHIFWEGTPDSLASYDLESKSLKPVRLYDDVVQDGRYNANIIENAYADEIRAFFDYVEKGVEPPYTFAEDAHTLAIVDEIEGLRGR
ncbi:MAG: Gfo/Idh/MocA family oxidoreductase [Kiritimatiellae bacterium]|nr:Gfo/Idh/MocA family oxidoreductase [Kiritimatiellia bacterium]